MVDYEHRLTKVEDLAQGNKRRIEKVERAQEDITALVESVASIAQKQKDMDGDMKEIKADVKLLAGKPAQRWESIVEKVLLTAVAALVGWCLLKIGIG
ncbi:MAG: hypothetical protein IJN76_01130 [Clostridia bacterium]|nr:hypothetical protein [Clostridia bacterium]